MCGSCAAHGVRCKRSAAGERATGACYVVLVQNGHGETTACFRMRSAEGGTKPQGENGRTCRSLGGGEGLTRTVQSKHKGAQVRINARSNTDATSIGEPLRAVAVPTTGKRDNPGAGANSLDMVLASAPTVPADDWEWPGP